MLDRAQWTYRNALKLSTAAAALGTAMAFASSPAQAQQVVPGNDPDCPIVMIDGEQVAICEGDLEDGITAFPGTPDFDEIIIRNPDAPIAPPGYFGIGLVSDNRDLDITIEDGVVINVFDDPNIAGVAQGVIAIAQNGFNIELETAADITADGNGSFALGIEAVAQGGGQVFVLNAGDIEAFTTGDSAIGVQARGTAVTVSNGNVIGFPAGGGNISVRSNGPGERDTVTAGILAVSTGNGFTILTDGADISVETGATSFDTDFNGIAGALVGNAFNSVGGSGIVSSGNLSAIGPQTHGIVGFVESRDADIHSTLTIISGSENSDETTISTNGVGSFGILAQGAGQNVIMDVLSNSAIDMTAVGGTSTGIFALNQAEEGSLTVTNHGTITGRGDTLRGIGATTFAAPVDGDYVFDITNEGDITLDARFGFGITAFATRDDDVDATITNSGNIDLSAVTSLGSMGISASFGVADPNADPMADGDSSVVINNSGDFTMGAGSAIFAAADNVTLTNTGDITHTPDGTDVVLIGGTGSSQEIDLIFRDSNITSESFTPSADYYVVRIEDAVAPSQYTLLFEDVTIRANEGGISLGVLQDDSNVTFTSQDLTMQLGASVGPGIIVEGFGDRTAAEFTLDRTAIDIGSPFVSAIDLAEIGEGSAFTFNMSNSAVFASGGTDNPAISIGGLGGINSALNVNLLDVGIGFAEATAFEIAKFSQEGSVSVFTVGGDSLIEVLRADSLGIAIGTATLGPIDNFSSTIQIQDSRVLTFGDRSTGIFVDSKMDGVTNSDFGILVRGVEISTDGTDAHGIEIIGAQNATLGDRDNISAGGAFSTVVVDATADITAAGANSDAIRVTNQDRTAITVGNGALVSGGTGDAVAIRLTGAEASSDAVDEITDQVTVAKAKIADNAMNTISDYIGDNGAAFDPITIDMFDARGFGRLVQVDNATVESMMGAGAIVSDGSLAVEGLNGAIIRSGNDDAPVVSAVEALAIIASDTTFSSMGDNAPLFSVAEMNMGDGTAFYGQLTNVTATTTGANSDAIATGGGVADSVAALFLRATDPMARNVVSTAGDGSHAISFEGPDRGTFTGSIADSDIATTGADAAAISLIMDDTSSMSLELFDSAVSTTGNASDAIALQTGETTDYTFLIVDSELTTDGDDSALVRVTGRGDTNDGTLVIIGSTLSSIGDNSAGITFEDDLNIGDSTNTFFIAQSSISTAGSDSDGFSFDRAESGGSNIASFTTDGVQISTSGADSDAFFIGSGGGGPVGTGSLMSAAIVDSQLATTGDNSRAWVTEALSSTSVQTLAVARGSFETSGENSTAVLLNDLSQLTFASGDSSVFIADFTDTDISTTGDNSLGIDVASLAGNNSTVVLTFGEVTISTEGTFSDAITIGSQSAMGSLGSSLTVFVGGNVITTMGDDSRGIFINALRDGLIADDLNMDGRFNGDGTILIEGSQITTQGARSHGIELGDIPAFTGPDMTNTSLEVATGTITTAGDGAHGIVIGSGWGSEGANSDDGRNQISSRFASVTVDGAIDVSGTGSHGIVSDSLINDFSISETGSITSADGFAINFSAVDEGQTALNLGTIYGDVIFGGGDDTLDSSGTFTGNIDMGGGANRIFIRAGGLFNSLDSVLLGAGNAIVVEGDIAPGGMGPIQTTAIGSDLFFEPGSRFLIDIDGMAADPNAAGFFQSDRITVDGNITIEDATLAVSSLTAEGDFDRSAQFLILDAAGTLTGEFGMIDADLPFLDLSVTYEAGRAILNAGRQGPVVPFASLGLTPNQRAVGASFDALEMTATGDLDDVIEQLIFANTDQALTAFDSASGEIYASLLAQAGNDGLRRSREAMARARGASSEGWGIWGGVGFSDSSVDGDGNGAAIDQTDFGVDFGIDYVGKDNVWAAGLSTGWRDGQLDVSARASSADYEAWYLTAHARYGSGGAGATIAGSAYFSETDANVSRILSVNALTRTALGQADVDSVAVAGEARYGFGIGGNWAVGPVFSIAHANSDLSLGNETGAGSVSLTSADASDGQTRLGAGLFANLQSETASFDLAAQYVDGASNSVGARLAFAEGSNAPFTVLAPVADQSGVLTSASAHAELGGGWTIGAQVEALFGSDRQDVTGSAVIGWQF